MSLMKGCWSSNGAGSLRLGDVDKACCSVFDTLRASLTGKTTGSGRGFDPAGLRSNSLLKEEEEKEEEEAFLPELTFSLWAAGHWPAHAWPQMQGITAVCACTT
jgi:hypothetical protein